MRVCNKCAAFQRMQIVHASISAAAAEIPVKH
jgi:hypothetical protein